MDRCLGPDIRYLKQIKPRNTELIYGASNVRTYRSRKEGKFLGFEHTGFSREHAYTKALDKQGMHGDNARGAAV